MVLEDGNYNADRPTMCSRIFQYHLTHLVSSNQEDFPYYQYNEKTILLYSGEFRVPPRVPAPVPESCGDKEACFSLEMRGGGGVVVALSRRGLCLEFYDIIASVSAFNFR